MRRTSWRTVKLSVVREPSPTPYQLRSSKDALGLVKSFLGDDPREGFAAVYLDSKHRPLAVHEISRGTVDAAYAHPREVFGPALMLSATALIVAHNHPSGDPTPSAEDRAITQRLKEIGELVGIPLLDHVVIGTERYFSFAEEAFFPYGV